MATSGSFYTNKYDNTVRLKLSWRSEQSIADNASRIYWTLESDGGSSNQWWYSAPITVVIGGKTALSITSRFKLYGDGKFRKTGNLSIPHNQDGSKSVAMSVKGAIYSSSVNCTGSQTFTLDKINRIAIIEDAYDFTDEEDAEMGFLIPDTSIATSIQARLKWLNADGETWEYTSWGDVQHEEGIEERGIVVFPLSGTAYINAMRSACPNSKSLAVFYELQSTINGVDYIDEKQATMAIVNADPVIPSGAFSYADTNADIVTITQDDQVIVRKQSELTISIDKTMVQFKKSASAYSYKLVFNDAVYFPDANGDVVFDKPDLAGTYTAQMFVTDTRGNFTSQELSITIYDWKIPSATYTLARTNGYEDETILTVNADFSSVDGINVGSIFEEHRKKGDTAWSSPASVTNGTPFSINAPTGLDKRYEWEVRITITDYFYSPLMEAYFGNVGRGIPLFYPDFKRKSIGINGIPDDDDQLYVDGKVKITGNLIVNGTPWSGRIQQVTLTQNITINTPDASGYFQLNDDLDFPDPNAVLIGMQVKCQNISATSGTIYSLVYWEDGQKPYIMYQHASVNFTSIPHDFIFTFYVP